MIGGKDIEIPVRQASAALDFAIRAVRERWPTAVFEDACTGETFNSYADIQFATTRELFAYRDRSAKAKWDELGADDSLTGTMLHFLGAETRITVVIDTYPPGEVMEIVKAIRTGLRRGVFSSILRRLAA